MDNEVAKAISALANAVSSTKKSNFIQLPLTAAILAGAVAVFQHCETETRENKALEMADKKSKTDSALEQSKFETTRKLEHVKYQRDLLLGIIQNYTQAKSTAERFRVVQLLPDLPMDDQQDATAFLRIVTIMYEQVRDELQQLDKYATAPDNKAPGAAIQNAQVQAMGVATLTRLEEIKHNAKPGSATPHYVQITKDADCEWLLRNLVEKFRQDHYDPQLHEMDNKKCALTIGNFSSLSEAYARARDFTLRRVKGFPLAIVTDGKEYRANYP